MNHGSLSLRGGVLHVARHVRRAHVQPFDLDGRALGPAFSFGGRGDSPLDLGGIDVDSDRQVWTVDARAGEVRAFSLFGRETAAFGGAPPERDDVRGVLADATDLALHETDEALSLVVSRGGVRRHALALLRRDGRLVESLRPLGDPLERFGGVSRVVQQGAWTYACEPTLGRVQVYRDFEFHFSFRIELRAGERAGPQALAVLPDRRLVIALSGSRTALVLADSVGRVLAPLALAGDGPGELRDVGDVAVEAGPSDRESRVAVLDRDAERLQVLTLDGRCLGEFEGLPGEAAAP